MSTPSPSRADIERRLRTLAAKFTGTAMGDRLAYGDHGASRELVISFLDDVGHAHDVGEELLDLADDVALLGESPID